MAVLQNTQTAEKPPHFSGKTFCQILWNSCVSSRQIFFPIPIFAILWSMETQLVMPTVQNWCYQFCRNDDVISTDNTFELYALLCSNTSLRSQGVSSITCVLWLGGRGAEDSQWYSSTGVNFKPGSHRGVRLGPNLGCCDLTEREAKKDLAVSAQTVYLPCLCQWSVWESWSKADTGRVNDRESGCRLGPARRSLVFCSVESVCVIELNAMTV